MLFFISLFLAVFSVSGVALGSVAPLEVKVKFVVFENSDAIPPVPSVHQVSKALRVMSKLWARCGISFSLGSYEQIKPEAFGLSYHPKNHSDLRKIRKSFRQSSSALYVATGRWDRAGDLGEDKSNAFSSVADGGPDGVVFENHVRPYLLAHEFGHLSGGLDDVSQEFNLMNHVVGVDTDQLDSSQCQQVRAKLLSRFREWLRI
ncbi:MAG: hypothetical protein AB1540_12330 [Bdellovibrionota bacterium]